MTTKYSSFEIEAPSEPGSPLKKIEKVSNPLVAALMCLFCIFNIISLFIVLTIHSFSVEENFSELLPLVDYVANNFITPPIRDITTASSSLTCQKDFTLLRLITWPGTVTGCFCPETNSIYQGFCNQEDSQTCMTVTAIDSQILWVWNNDAFCIRRLQDFYLKPVNNDCSQGYLNCGRFCVKEGEACPITNLQIVATSSVPADPSTESVTLSNDRSFIINRDPSNRSLFDIDIHFYETPCLQPTMRPDTPGPTYPLLEVTNVIGCGTYGYDNSSRDIDSQNMLSVLAQNNITSLQTLPLFNSYEKDTNAYLVLRPRLAVRHTDYCQAIDLRRLNVMDSLVGSFKKWVIGSTIFPLIAVIAYWVYLMYLLFDDGVKKFVKKSSKQWVSWLCLTGCLFVIFLFKSFLSNKNQDILDQQAFYVSVGTADCFEDEEISKGLIAFSSQIPLVTENIMSFVNRTFWIAFIVYLAAVIAKAYHLIYKKFVD